MVGVRTYGRMGNFLFQAAACISYALKHNLDFSLPNKTNDPFWNPLYLQHLVNPSYQQGREDILINENGHEYKEIEFREEWRDRQIVLNGYFQSAKYFQEHRNEIIYLFGFPYELKPVCSIHARFGDYLIIKGKHIIIDEPYLNSAMELIKQKTGIDRFKVFSDDVKHFKNKLGHLHNFEYSENNNETADLIEMSCCHSSINSSSTFSWWSSWINQNPDKIVITPSKWFQDGWMDMNTDDVIPPEWIKL